MKKLLQVVLCLSLCLFCTSCTEPFADESDASVISMPLDVSADLTQPPEEPTLLFMEPYYYGSDEDRTYGEIIIDGKSITTRTDYKTRPYWLNPYNEKFIEPYCEGETRKIHFQGKEYICKYSHSVNKLGSALKYYYFTPDTDPSVGELRGNFGYDLRQEKIVSFRLSDFPNHDEEKLDMDELAQIALEAVQEQTGIMEGWVERKAERNENLHGASNVYKGFAFAQYQNNIRVADVSIALCAHGHILEMDWQNVQYFPNVQVPDWSEDYYLQVAREELESVYHLELNGLLSYSPTIQEIKYFELVPDSLHYFAVPERRIDTISYTVTYSTVQMDGTEIKRDMPVALVYQPH